jgi:riboflavin kinase
MAKFPEDFYGAQLTLVVLGFVRPEYDYDSLDALVEDINTDIEVTQRSLDRPAYAKFKDEAFLVDFSDVSKVVE